MNKTSKLLIGIYSILGWLFGVIFILMGFTYIGRYGLSISNIAFFIMGAIILPPTTKFIKEKFNYTMTAKFKAIVFVIAFFVNVFTFQINPELSTTQGSQIKDSSTKNYSIELNEKEVREYEIIETEDISQRYMKRMTYYITIPIDITPDEMKATLTKVIQLKSKSDNDIDEITVFAYESKESYESSNLPLGRAIWAPYGEYGNLNITIGKENTRENHEISYEIDEDLLNSLEDKIVSEDKFGFTEDTRKGIFKELVYCEDWAMAESAQYHDRMCSSCESFISDDFSKMVDKQDELQKQCESKIDEKYKIDEDIRTQIAVEGMVDRWATAKMVPMPACCDY